MIPEDWDVSTVGREFEVKLGKMLDAEKNLGVPKPYLGNRAVQWDRIDVSELPIVRLTNADMKRFRLRKGDLLVCEGGEVGRAAIWEAPIDECYYQKALHRLRPLHGFEPKVMVALLWRWSQRGALSNYVTQTSIAHLPREKFVEVPMPVPPAPEQRAIAQALGDVDVLLLGLDRLIAKKRNLKGAAMRQLLSCTTRLPGFSREWETTSIADLERRNLVRLSRGKVISASDIMDIPGEFPIYSSSVHDNGLFGCYGAFMFDEELITWSIDGGGHFFHRPKHKFSVTNVCGFMRIDTSRINYRFLAAALQLGHSRKSFDYQSKAHPSVVRKEYEVRLPSLSEQTAIAVVLSEMDDDIAALESRRDKTKCLKYAMMQELLTGKTRIVQAELAIA
jgi:type I restriction enzyme, S subunit